LPAQSPFLERGGTGNLSINITPQVQSGFLWPQPQAWLICVLLPAGWITLLGFIIILGGKPEIQQTDQTERTQVSCYAVMQVLYVSSMQWPSAVRLMRGI